MKFLIPALLFTAFAAFLILRQPDDFHFARNIRIAAPAEKIFAHVNNVKQWKQWSPWAKLDPNAVETYAGPEEGANASMSWKGNMEVGAGTMTVTESVPGRYIKFRLDFKEPMASTATAEFTFTDLDNGETLVDWSMSGKAALINKAMSLIFNCERMMGEQFNAGLTSLKKISEAESISE